MLLPIGAEGPARGRPYVTWALAIVCAVVFFATLPEQRAAEARLEAAGAAIEGVVAQAPDVRSALDGEGLPDALRARFFAPYHRAHHVAAIAADYDLERAQRELLDAAAGMPTHRYGFRIHGPWTGLVTSLFMHAGLLHLLGNLLLLVVAGAIVEPGLGHARFLSTYLSAGVAAAVGNASFTSTPDVPLVGPSGAVFGIVGVLLVGMPRARLRVMLTLAPYVLLPLLAVLTRWNALVVGTFFGLALFFVVRLAASGRLLTWFFSVPAFVAFPLAFAVELARVLVSAPEATRVAHWAHGIGFVFGGLAELDRRRGLRRARRHGRSDALGEEPPG